MICDGCTHAECCPAKEEHGGAKRCSAFKPQEMTNEEWLRQANTEQLAEWIASVVQKAISIKENNGIVMLESAIWWDEWLKQPHQMTTK